MKHCLIAVMVVACFTAGAQGRDQVWTGAVDDNWDVANNWYTGFPNDNLAYVGSPAYPNAVVIVTDSSRATNPGSVLVGGSDVGSLTINGALTVENHINVGAYDIHFAPADPLVPVPDPNAWKDPGTGTLTVNGRLTMGIGGRFYIGGTGYGTVYLNSGGVIETPGEGALAYFGMDYHEGYGEEFAFYQNGGTFITRKLQMVAYDVDGTDCNVALWKLSGGTVIMDPNHYGAGLRIYSGTVEIAGQATIIGGFLRMSKYSAYTNQNPILKISGMAGTGSKLTAEALSFGQAYLDVSEANMPAGWTWVTIVDGNALIDPNTGGGGDLTFIAGTDTNEWKLRLDANDNNDVEIMLAITGDMDGSAALNTDDVTPFVLALTDPNAYIVQYGLDPNLVGDVDNSGKLDADDISPFVTKLTGGAASVPEPTALALLTLAGAVFIRRRGRAKH